MKFNIGQKVICIWGTNKGLELEIIRVRKNEYHLKDKNGKIYTYKENHLKG